MSKAGRILIALVAALLLGISIAGAATPVGAATAAAPAEIQAQARDIYQTIIGLETSAGTVQVPVMARYLAGQFRAAGFPASDIHILPLGETASLSCAMPATAAADAPSCCSRTWTSWL